MNKNFKSFKDSLRHFFLKYALIPIFILICLFSIFFVSITRIDIIINSKKAGKNIMSHITETYDNYYGEMKRLSASCNLVNYINKRKDLNLVYDEYYKFVNTQKIKGAFHLIDDRGVFLISTSNSDGNTERDILKYVIPEVKKNPDNILTEINLISYDNDKKTSYTFSTSIKDSTNTIIGYIVYQLYAYDFQCLLFEQNNELAIITDTRNRVVATNNNSLVGLMNKFSPNYYNGNENFVNIAENKYYLNRTTTEGYPLYVYTLNSFNVKTYIFMIYFIFMILIVALSMLLIFYFANKVSDKNSSSIDKLIYSINELKTGNLKSYVNINSGDEFEVLADEFNNMLDTLNSLLSKNEELRDLNYISELKLLQSQFNPHFIFNVLETLKYSIVLAPKDSEKIIMGLSRLLRYSINSDNKKVILKNDLNYIKDFLELNKFRFKDKLKYNIHIYDNSENALIPKLLLQTIVENSIKYGYKNKNNLEININSSISNETLILTVNDNGAGMSEDELESIKKIMSSTNNNSNHIGLYNAYRKLVLLYGDDQSFEINSSLGEGTTVTLIIPFEEGDSNV